jgi:hypothetical protein
LSAIRFTVGDQVRGWDVGAKLAASTKTHYSALELF